MPKRFLSIDSLRGMLLVMMAVNHIPSDLQIATNHIFGFVSAAEGFVFLSGLMAGLVYSRRYDRSGGEAIQESAVRRSIGIYLFHVATYLLIFLGVRYCAAWSGTAPIIAPKVMLDHPWASIVSGLLFLQQPSLFDILPMYCAFLLTVPVVVIACHRGERVAVLTASFLLWGITNLLSPQTPYIHGVLNTGSFNLLAWQLLFVVGTVFGQAWATGSRLWPRPRADLIAGVLLAAGFMYGVRHALIPLPAAHRWFDQLTNKNNLAPLRLFNGGLLFYLVYVVAVRFPSVLTWKPFVYLGQHSMFVFAVHILAAYALQAFPELFGLTSGGRWLSTVLMVGTLFAAATGHQLWQERAKRNAAQVRARQDWLSRPKLGHGS